MLFMVDKGLRATGLGQVVSVVHSVDKFNVHGEKSKLMYHKGRCKSDCVRTENTEPYHCFPYCVVFVFMSGACGAHGCPGGSWL